MFIIGNQGLPMRVVVGVTMLAAAVALVFLARTKTPEPTVHIHQDIDIAGDVEMEQLKCRNCGGPLDDESVTLREGAIFIECPYCNTSYEVEEAPKW